MQEKNKFKVLVNYGKIMVLKKHLLIYDSALVHVTVKSLFISIYLQDTGPLTNGVPPTCVVLVRQ